MKNLEILKHTLYNDHGYNVLLSCIRSVFDSPKVLFNKDEFLGFKNKTLVEIVEQSYGDMELISIYNYCSMCLMYHIFIDRIDTNKSCLQDAKVISCINKSFGSIKGMKKSYMDKVCDIFGSCWIVLYIDTNDKLEWLLTLNAFNPINISTVKKIILCFPVWEHNYIGTCSVLDYTNYLYDNCINWNFLSSSVGEARIV